jgi:hypothetical protein
VESRDGWAAEKLRRRRRRGVVIGVACVAADRSEASQASRRRCRDIVIGVAAVAGIAVSL